MRAKQLGFGDAHIALIVGVEHDEVRAARLAAGVTPVFKQVDTCAAEFESVTSYFYSTFEVGENEASRSDERRMRVGSGGHPASVSRRSAGNSGRTDGPWRRASHQTRGKAHRRAITET